MKQVVLSFGLVCIGLFGGCGDDSPDSSLAATKDPRPNILIILVDDMGFTDLGSFGSEIPTPNIDRLALSGLRLTNFHASPQCAPTRAMLMSGADNHKAGLGAMFDETFIEGGFGDRPGYEMYLHPRVATLPERLGDAGYNTYMTGKWHLGEDDEKKPTARGFDRAFALISGSGSHMNMRSVARPAMYREDGDIVDELPADFYSTNAYTDKMIGFIESGLNDDKPFFAYFAPTAPGDYLNRFRGSYDEGYDVQRARRVERAVQMGIVPDVVDGLLDPVGEPWDSLSVEEKRYSARTMELYAAMMANLDDNVGRLLARLEQIGELDNTLIVFMSDNGAEADREDRNPTYVRGIAREEVDNSYDNLGKATSFAFIREGWAQASTAPFRMYKGFLTEGGTRVASFAWHASMQTGGAIDSQYLNVMDVMPTLLDVAEAEFDAGTVRGRKVLPMDGRSFRSILEGSGERIHSEDEFFAFELHGQRAIRRGNWKAVWEQMTANIWYADERPAPHWNRWQLFDLADDPAEQHDLSEAEPEVLAELVAQWEAWAAENSIKTDVVPRWPSDWLTGSH